MIDKNLSKGEKYGIPVIAKEDVINNEKLKKYKFVVTAPKYREEISYEIKKTFGDIRIYSFEAEIYYTFIRDVNAYREYLLEHFEELAALYEVLQDEKSRETLTAFVKGRISGNQKYFTDVMAPDQYFPDDIVKLGKEEVLVEVGSNDGKTLLDILDRTHGQFEKIYCFEPDRECISQLKKIINQSGRPIELVSKGVGSKSCRMYFQADPKYGTSKVTESEDYDYTVDVVPLDEALPARVTYIKMDIEGMEMECLKGAKTMISRYSPKLAVCVYHRPEDILEIPQYLKKLNPQYRFYLRHHNCSATETVLYAVV